MLSEEGIKLSDLFNERDEVRMQLRCSQDNGGFVAMLKAIRIHLS